MTTHYSCFILPHVFPRADFYTELGRARARKIGERETRARRFA
jgi:hypothetical protein